MSDNVPSSPPRAQRRRSSRNVRLVGAGDRTGLKATYENSWAVVIGINGYANGIRPLNYAVNDADAFARLIIEELGFPREQVFVILDPPPKAGDAPYDLMATKATFDTIRRLLVDELPEKSRSDDRVLIFFAGHGERRKLPSGERIGYLVPADAKPGQWSTHIEMEEVIKAGNLCQAKHVFYLLDACYSGLAFGRSTVQPTPYEETMLTTPARQALTAGTARQAVNDSGPKGHSPFTWYVLQGLRGEAAQPGSEVITASDLMVYVKNQVGQKYGLRQVPDLGKLPGHESGGDFIFRLPARKDLSAQEHYQLGCALYRMGWLLPDRNRFPSASRHLREALQTADERREAFPQARLQLGLAQMAAGEHREAIATLQVACAAGDPEVAADAAYHLGIAHAKGGDTQGALEAIDRFLTGYPGDPRAAWLAEFQAGLQGQLRPPCHALLIGIGHYQDSRLTPLSGASVDVETVRRLLAERFSFPEVNTTVLMDAGATRDGILGALASLETAEPQGQVFVYFTGWGWVQNVESNAYLMPYDFRLEELANGIGADEFHACLARIPGAHKVVVLDGAPSGKFAEIAGRARAYTLYASAEPGQLPYELMIDGVQRSIFTYSLVQQLGEAPTVPMSVLHAKVSAQVIERLHGQRVSQAPQLIGAIDRPLLMAPASDDPAPLAVFDFSQRGCYADLTLDELRQLAGRYRTVGGAPFPGLAYSMGKGFLDKEAFPLALSCFETAEAQSPVPFPLARLGRAIALLRLQRYDEACAALEGYRQAVPEHAEGLAEVVQIIDRLPLTGLRVLLVGVSEYQNRELPAVQGALNDVAGMARALTEQCGVPEANIVTLINAQVDRSSLLEAFRDLTGAAWQQPALFYFAGNGSRTADGQPAILPYDAQGTTANDIALSELAGEVQRIARDVPTNLMVVIDAGWAEGLQLPWGASWGSRFAPVYDRPDPIGPSGPAFGAEGWSWGGAWRPDDPRWVAQRGGMAERLASLRIGRTTIYPAAVQAALLYERVSPAEAIAEAEFSSPFGEPKKVIHGVLAHTLIKSLREIRREDLTFAALQAFFERELKWLQPFCIGGKPDERLFSNQVQEAEAEKLIQEIVYQEPIRRAAKLLNQRIKQRDGKDPDSWLELGIAHAALAEYEESKNALEEAIKQDTGAHGLEARYYLGRVLFESSDDLDKAVSELRAVVDKEAENVSALYYYGQAIRARVERKTLQVAAEALDKYLRAGAPLGHRAEVQAFLAGQAQIGPGTGSGWLPVTPAGPGSGPGSGTRTGWAPAPGAGGDAGSRAG